MTTMSTKLLPPLILHPFSDQGGPSKLVRSSRASLMLQGLLPSGEASADDLERTLLDGRFCEIRMLYYVGKDLMRWIDQCLEITRRDDEFLRFGIQAQSFAAMLVEAPPSPVKEKLQKWGVADYKAIFSRAIGLNALFAQAPERTDLSDEFVRNYYRYADQLYACWMNAKDHSDVRYGLFDFQLYASGEYSRLLEREWQD